MTLGNILLDYVYILCLRNYRNCTNYLIKLIMGSGGFSYTAFNCTMMERMRR